MRAQAAYVRSPLPSPRLTHSGWLCKSLAVAITPSLPPPARLHPRSASTQSYRSSRRYAFAPWLPQAGPHGTRGGQVRQRHCWQVDRHCSPSVGGGLQGEGGRRGWCERGGGGGCMCVTGWVKERESMCVRRAPGPVRARGPTLNTLSPLPPL